MLLQEDNQPRSWWLKFEALCQYFSKTDSKSVLSLPSKPAQVMSTFSSRDFLIFCLTFGYPFFWFFFLLKYHIEGQGFIGGDRDRDRGFRPPPPPPPHSESLGGISPPLFLLIQKETCHQGIINSWLCYSLLGEALSILVIPGSLPLVGYFQNISRIT